MLGAAGQQVLAGWSVGAGAALYSSASPGPGGGSAPQCAHPSASLRSASCGESGVSAWRGRGARGGAGRDSRAAARSRGRGHGRAGWGWRRAAAGGGAWRRVASPAGARPPAAAPPPPPPPRPRGDPPGNGGARLAGRLGAGPRGKRGAPPTRATHRGGGTAPRGCPHLPGNTRTAPPAAAASHSSRRRRPRQPAPARSTALTASLWPLSPAPAPPRSPAWRKRSWVMAFPWQNHGLSHTAAHCGYLV